MASENLISRSVRFKTTFVVWFWMPVLISSVACVCSVWLYYWDIFRLLEYQKCPTCYGESLCPLLQKHPDSLKVNYFGYFGWIVNSIATKNVYKGSLNSTDVMIKCLGMKSELKEMDKKLCMKIPIFCQDQVGSLDELYDTIIKDVKNLLSSQLMIEQQEVNFLRFCPSLENLGTLLSNMQNQIKEDTLLLTPSRLANIWTILHINAEPLILQIFPKDEGWPFPQYLGACGRVIVETYEGISLLNFYSESWKERARLSLQLLEAVDKFILHSPDFALYLLDYSPDNIAVNADHRISFVDLEHTIIVDKHSSLFSQKQNTVHQSGTFCSEADEADCSYYSPDDICEHQISDFNHYMLCKEILSPSKDPYVAMPQGLLHSIPPHIHQKYPLFEAALLNCSSASNLNHILPAQILRDILQEVGRQ